MVVGSRLGGRWVVTGRGAQEAEGRLAPLPGRTTEGGGWGVEDGGWLVQVWVQTLMWGWSGTGRREGVLFGMWQNETKWQNGRMEKRQKLDLTRYHYSLYTNFDYIQHTYHSLTA